MSKVPLNKQITFGFGFYSSKLTKTLGISNVSYWTVVLLQLLSDFPVFYKIWGVRP